MLIPFGSQFVFFAAVFYDSVSQNDIIFSSSLTTHGVQLDSVRHSLCSFLHFHFTNIPSSNTADKQTAIMTIDMLVLLRITFYLRF